MKFHSHAFASSRIITPESATQSCWLYRFFKCQHCIFSQRSRGEPWFVLLSKQCQYMRWVWQSVFTISPSLNDSQQILCNSLHEFCLCCKSYRKVDKCFTITPERRSIDTWIVVNFFHPMTADNFPSLRSLRDCFWIITSSSINITMINPKIFSFLPCFFCSTNR